jgi:site-specific recombinase XerD
VFTLTWQIDEGKFLGETEVKKLRNHLRRRSNDALRNEKKIAIRDWLVIDLGLSTGLRVSEMANLCCGDIWVDDGRASLIVRKGKGGRPRIVKFGAGFKRHLEAYLAWKKRIGENGRPEDPLITSSNSKRKMSTRGLQKIFDRNAERVGIQGHSIHSLRHTYATFLLRASGNLRLVQKQLGHSSVTITEVYADVMNPDLDRALERLYRN